MKINFSELVETYREDYMHWMGQLECAHFGTGLDPDSQLSRCMALYFKKGLDFENLVNICKREGPEMVELEGECIEIPVPTLQALAITALFHHQHVLKKPPVQVFTDPRLHKIVDILGAERVCFLSAITVAVVDNNSFDVSFAPEYWYVREVS